MAATTGTAMWTSPSEYVPFASSLSEEGPGERATDRWRKPSADPERISQCRRTGILDPGGSRAHRPRGGMARLVIPSGYRGDHRGGAGEAPVDPKGYRRGRGGRCVRWWHRRGRIQSRGRVQHPRRRPGDLLGAGSRGPTGQLVGGDRPGATRLRDRAYAPVCRRGRSVPPVRRACVRRTKGLLWKRTDGVPIGRSYAPVEQGTARVSV